MAQKWKGTILEPHMVAFLSMLLQEDGTLTAERRHDNLDSRGYLGIGIQAHNVCARGTPQIYVQAGQPFRKFCSWKDGKSPMQQFTDAYPKFATDWEEQFKEYTLRMTQCIQSGNSEDQCIQSWNSREEGRIAKVKKHKAFITNAITPLFAIK